MIDLSGILTHIKNKNPWLGENVFLLQRDGEWQEGIADIYCNSAYLRVDAFDDADQVFFDNDPEKFENISRVNLVAVFCTKRLKNKLEFCRKIASQFFEIAGVSPTSVAFDTELIYESETGQKLTNEDIDLFRVKFQYEFFFNNCEDTFCLDYDC